MLFTLEADALTETAANIPPGMTAPAGWVGLTMYCGYEEAPVGTPQFVGDANASGVAGPSMSSESPGSGNTTSFEATVPQLPPLMLAVNMSGSALKEVIWRSLS